MDTEKKSTVTDSDILELRRVCPPANIGDLTDLIIRNSARSDKARASGNFKKASNLSRRVREYQSKLRGTHFDSQWNILLRITGHRCLRCDCVPTGRPTKDHIVSISNGGSDSIGNLQPLCRECNSAKTGMDYRPEWLTEILNGVDKCPTK